MISSETLIDLYTEIEDRSDKSLDYVMSCFLNLYGLSETTKHDVAYHIRALRRIIAEHAIDRMREESQQ